MKGPIQPFLGPPREFLMQTQINFTTFRLGSWPATLISFPHMKIKELLWEILREDTLNFPVENRNQKWCMIMARIVALKGSREVRKGSRLDAKFSRS